MKILVIRVGRVGDTVMITPAIKSLLDQYQNAVIHVLVSPDGRRVLDGFDGRLESTIVYDRKLLNIYSVRRRIKKIIHNNKYDQIYCFEYNPSFYQLIDGASKHIRKIGHSAKANHYAEHCLDLVRREYISERDSQWAHLPVSSGGKLRSSELLQGIAHDDTFLIGFHPSFSGTKKGLWRRKKNFKNKMWPEDHFGKLAMLLTQYAKAENIKLRIIVDLLPEELSIGEAIEKASGHCVTVLTPAPDFDRYKATLQRLDLLITPDTGPMHVAAAVGAKIVALFSEKDPKDCGPYAPVEQYKVLRAEDTSNPELGIAAISPEEVLCAAKQFIQSRNEGVERKR